MLTLLTWALLVWTSAALGFLCVRRTFSGWIDQGYGVAKVIGPLLVASTSWLLSALGPFTPSLGTSIAAWGVVAVAAISLGWRDRHLPLPPRRVVLAIDVAWLAGVGLFGALRAINPSIIGAERLMDHALLAASLHQTAHPPADPWLAGFPVNYHYIGHALWASFARASLQPPSVVYNLVLAMIPSQLLVAAWSVAHRVGPRWAWAGPGALVFAGSLATLSELASTWRLPAGAAGTRVIAGTINEFPFFSLTWGDLHAHVIALPMLVAFAACVVCLGELARTGARGRIVAAAALAAAIGTLSVLVSSWELLPVGLGVTWALVVMRRLPMATVAPAAVAALATGLAIAWPVMTTFRPPLVATGWEWQGSQVGPFLLVQGIWLFPIALLCVLRSRLVVNAAVLLVLVCLAWLAPGVVVRVALLALAAGAWVRRDDLGGAATALVLSAVCLLVVAECIWVDDVYGWDHRRLNVVFKSHLQAIVCLALALPAIVQVLWTLRARPARATARGALIAVAIVSASSAFVVAATRYRAREPGLSLDGLVGMARHHPGDAAAVRYLWTHATTADVVLEAAAESYTYGSRISAMTGVPTLLGWKGHEHLWRRGPEWQRRIDERARLVDRLYDGPVQDLGTRLREAGIRYVVIGPVERRRYPNLAPARFAGVATTVVNEDATVVLRVF